MMMQTISEMKGYVTLNWERLVDALRDELQEYGALLNLLNAHEDSIVGRDLDQVLKLNESIESQILESTKIRQLREAVVCEFARDSGVKEDATIKEMLYLFPEHAQGLLLTLVNEIVSMIQKTQQKIRKNQMLIKRATEFTEEFLCRLQNRPRTKTYNRYGQVKSGMSVQVGCMNAVA